MQTENTATIASPVAIDDTRVVTDDIETLARRHQAELMRIMRARIGNEDDARDLVQEAYTRLLRYQGQYSGEELKRHLFRIASNLLADHWRRKRQQRRDAHVPIDDLSLESGVPEQDRQLAAQQDLARLKECILNMPPRRRDVLILSRIHGLSNAEIAAHCGIAIKTVEKHLALAISECRDEVGDDAR
jgi:RNA polymerase sigma factor (sigma-70 family)